MERDRGSRDQKRVVPGSEEALHHLAHVVGNELRNPLAAVQNAHYYLARKLAGSEVAREDPRIAQFLGVIERELEASSRVLDDLRDFGTSHVPAKTSFPVREMVDGALVPVRRPAHVTLVNDVDALLPLVSLDRVMCARIVRHLAQNGCDALATSRAGKVVVRAREDGNDLLLCVEDDGEGIAAADLPHVTRPLFSTRAKGTGLGLTIVSALVGCQGGSLAFESTVGAGTIATVRFPRA